MTDPRAPRTRGRLLLPLLAAALGCAPLAAQGLAPKRQAVEAPRACVAAAAPAAPAPARREEAVRLAAAADQAAILGDDGEARDLFRRAAALDPTDASVAYRLARLHEDLGEPASAAAEYCRYLALAPESADAPEVAARAARLGPVRDPGRESAAARFAEGVRSLDRGESARALDAFDAALRARPDWPEAHYNRALALLGAGRGEPAAAALESYLRYSPAAPDAAQVRAAVRALRRPVPAFTPEGSLARGLLLPGLGQFHTRRPALGAAVLAGAGAALLAALRSEEVTRTGTALDPFGNPYPYSYRDTERPALGVGMGAAAAITLAAAAEAYLYARRAGAGSRPYLLRGAALRPEPGAAPSGGVRLGLTIRAP